MLDHLFGQDCPNLEHKEAYYEKEKELIDEIQNVFRTAMSDAVKVHSMLLNRLDEEGKSPYPFTMKPASVQKRLSFYWIKSKQRAKDF